MSGPVFMLGLAPADSVQQTPVKLVGIDGWEMVKNCWSFFCKAVPSVSSRYVTNKLVRAVRLWMTQGGMSALPHCCRVCEWKHMEHATNSQSRVWNKPWPLCSVKTQEQTRASSCPQRRLCMFLCLHFHFHFPNHIYPFIFWLHI